MRIIGIILLLTLASCASVETRTDRNSGVGFDSFSEG